MMNRILITVVLSVFIALLGVGIVIPVLPLLAVNLGATGFTLGLITAAFSVSRGLVQPGVGSLSDRWGRKGFLVVGFFIYGLVGLLIPYATSVFHLILIRLFQGIGSAMIIPVAMAYASALSPVGQEGRYMSVINIAIFCGIGFGPVLGGIFADLWGLASVFYMMATLCFIACVLVVVNMPASCPGDGHMAVGLQVSMRRMMARRRTMGILLARFSTVLMMVPTMAFLPVMMAPWPDSSGLQVGLVIAGRTMMNAVLQIPFGRLADKHDKVVLLLLGCICMSIAIFSIPMASTFMAIMGLYLFLGFGEAILWPVLGAYAAEEGRTHFGHGTMMGVFNLAMSAGVFTGAILAGVSMDSWGMPQAFRITAVAVLVLSLIAAVMIRTGEHSGETVGSAS
ncbi:MFS transporter [Desulfobulbus alkaliphilus]|uniref:MFS transporter n=1 Tax=Desulfobulbus alkaliphilus TaxID=869814 RepID=UPI001966A5D4|nr:MFS transporter [Desulfobulbus alkaliphilus]MBM9536468.1 MFS transporter [Desulfobulbus alkaliphilus]